MGVIPGQVWPSGDTKSWFPPQAAGAEGVQAVQQQRWSGAQCELHPAKFGACKKIFFFFHQWGLNLAGTGHHPPQQPWLSRGFSSSCELPPACPTAVTSACPRGAEHPPAPDLQLPWAPCCAPSSAGTPSFPTAPRAPQPGFCHLPSHVSSANFTCSDFIACLCAEGK